MCHVAVVVCVIGWVVFFQALIVDCEVDGVEVGGVGSCVASECVGDGVDLLQKVMCVDLL